MRVYKGVTENGNIFSSHLCYYPIWDCHGEEIIEVKEGDAEEALKLCLGTDQPDTKIQDELCYTVTQWKLIQHNQIVTNRTKPSAPCHYCPGYMDLGSVTERLSKWIPLEAGRPHKNTSLKHTSSHTILIHHLSSHCIH